MTSDVLLSPLVSSLIGEYTNSSHLFTGTVCKDWSFPNKETSLDNACSSFSCLKELVKSGYKDKDACITNRVIRNGNIESLKYILKYKYSTNHMSALYSCIRGDIEIMKNLYNILGSKFHDYSSMAYAAENGNLDNMKWLNKMGCEVKPRFTMYNVFSSAAKYGNLDNMKWLYDKGYEFTYDTLDKASINGNLENMKWLYKNGCKLSKQTLGYAAYHGNRENMEWLISVGAEINGNELIESLSKGNIENTEWLKSLGCEFKTGCFVNAAENGDFEMMKYLHENNCPWNTDLFRNAIRYGDLDIMKWIYKNGLHGGKEESRFGFRHDDFISDAMFSESKSENILWLIDIGSHVDYSTLSSSIYNKRWDICMFLIKHGLNKNERTLKYIHDRGNIDLMREAVENGCMVHSSALSFALKKNDMDVVKWLVSIDCGWENDVLVTALKYVNIETAEWLISEGCPFYSSMPCYDASINGDMDMLSWLHVNKCPLDMRGACRTGNFELIKWLHSNGATFDTQYLVDENLIVRYPGAAFQNAIMYGDLSIIKWIHENGCDIEKCEFNVDKRSMKTFSWITNSSYFMKYAEENCSYSSYGNDVILAHGFIYLIPMDESLETDSYDSDVLEWLASIGWTIYCSGMLDISDW